MHHSMNRRDWIRVVTASSAAAGLGVTATPTAPAQTPGESSGFQSSVIKANEIVSPQNCPSVVEGRVLQPARELPVLHSTDVLVVGGGPAGICAAIAAKRAGASVTIVERYGHFGGLWTGGLVLLVIGHIVKGGQQVCQGIGEEMMRRLDRMPGAIVDRRPGVSPTVDAEAVKYLMVEMIEEAGIKVYPALLGCRCDRQRQHSSGRRIRKQVRTASDPRQDGYRCHGRRRPVRRRRRGLRTPLA